MIVLIMRGDGGPRTRRLGVLKLLLQAESLKIVSRRQPTEFNQGRIDVEKFDRTSALRRSGNAWASENESPDSHMPRNESEGLSAINPRAPPTRLGAADARKHGLPAVG